MLPGPGRYQAEKKSVMKKSNKYSFGRANDRFHCPTKHTTEPCITSYTPKAGMGEYAISHHNKALQTKFGRNNEDIISKHFRSSTGVPGPGSYNSYSDFTGL